MPERLFIIILHISERILEVNVGKKIMLHVLSALKGDVTGNTLTFGFLFLMFIACIYSENYTEAVLMVAAAVLYLFGAVKLVGIRKYFPVTLAVISVMVFIVAGVFFAITRSIPFGFVPFACVIMYFVLSGFGSIAGAKCIPYCIAMFGAEAVLSFYGDTRCMVVMVGALVLALFFTDSTYTALSKYVFTLFLSLLLIKLSGIFDMIFHIEAEGLVDRFISSSGLYIVLAFLGILSLLLRERHPRIKSDRDKKNIPVLKMWKIIIGMSVVLCVLFGMANFNGIFAADYSGLTDDMRMNLVYLVGATVSGESLMMMLMGKYGFVVLFLFIMLIVSFMYKAYIAYKETKAPGDKLMFLMMVGFFISFAYFNATWPMICLCALMAGTLNTPLPAESEDAK